MRRSSIFSSESLGAITPGDRAAIWRTLLTTLGCLVVLDVALRLLQPVPLYGGWEHQQSHLKADGYRAAVAEHGAIDLLLYGNSVVQTIDLERFAAAHSGRQLSVYNAGVGGLTPETAGFFLQHGLLPAGKPRAIVYVIGPRDLRDQGGNAVRRHHGTFFNSNMARGLLAETPTERLEVVAERVSYAFGARRALRALLATGRHTGAETIRANEYGVTSYYESFLTVDEYPKDFFYRSRYNLYEINHDAGRIRSLAEMIELCRDHGIRLVLVTSPIAPAAFSLFDDPENDYATFESALRQLAADHEVPLFDMHGDLQLPNYGFCNPDHVNGKGAAYLEAYLFERVFPVALDDATTALPNELQPLRRDRYLIDAYEVEIDAVSAKIASGKRNRPDLVHAHPGPPGQPTVLTYRDVRLGQTGTIRFEYGVRKKSFARGDGVRFRIFIDGVQRFDETLRPGQTPNKESRKVEVPELAGQVVSIALQTDCVGSRKHDRAYWRKITLD